MIASFVKVNVRPGKKEKLIDFLKWDVQVAFDEEPATLRLDVFEDAEDDSLIYCMRHTLMMQDSRRTKLVHLYRSSLVRG